MVGCDECKQWFYTEGGLNIHKAKAHCGNIRVPDLIGMGVVKRKLTPEESKIITKEVMNMKIEDDDLRFRMAIVKCIEITN